jgi:uncharacterized protein (TIGR02246 family)
VDERRANTLVSEVEAAWNAHDMRRFAELFAEDADFVNVGGWWYRGRAEIEENHAAVHETIFRASAMELHPAAFKPVDRDVSVLHVKWRMAGHDASGVEGTTEPRHGIWSWVVRDRNDHVEIVSSHNTDTLPAPPGHPLEHLALR